MCEDLFIIVEMAKVLLLSHIPVYPKIGGDRIRIAQTLSMLLDDHEVDLVYISHRPSTPPIKDFEPRIRNEWKFYVPSFTRWCQASRTLFNRRPLEVNHFMHRPFRRFLNGIIDKYDFIVCGSAVMAAYVVERRDCVRYLDMTDSLTMNCDNAARRSSGVLRWLYELNARRMRRYEMECAASFDRIAYISESDRDYVVGKCGGRTVIVPNSVRIPDTGDCPDRRSDSDALVFVGKMDYEPNVTAVTNFARNVLPLINAGGRRFVFRIVGASPTAEVRELGRLSDVEVTGFVDSVTPYFREAAMVVAPMLSGSGVQNKILQALALGCCVATTGIGAEGIESLEEALVVCPEDPRQMAAMISAFLDDRESLNRKGRLGRTLVGGQFGYDAVKRDFRRFVSPSISQPLRK